VNVLFLLISSVVAGALTWLSVQAPPVSAHGVSLVCLTLLGAALGALMHASDYLRAMSRNVFGDRPWKKVANTAFLCVYVLGLLVTLTTASPLSAAMACIGGSIIVGVLVAAVIRHVFTRN
jgi:hypothetical protein